MKVLKNILLFPFRVIWGVIMWPLKSLYGFFFNDKTKPVKFVELTKKPVKFIELTREELVSAEIALWYTSKGKDATRSIHEMLADTLEEGVVNPRDWIDKPRRRSGGGNWQYVGQNPDYKDGKRKISRFVIKERSIGPHGKCIKNTFWEKGFKLRRHERIYKTEEELIEAECVDEVTAKPQPLTTISDVDDLNRDMVIINPHDQKISLRMVGESYHKDFISGRLSGRSIVLDDTLNFKFEAGDIISIKESQLTGAIGHYTLECSSKDGSVLVLDRNATPQNVNTKIKFKISKPSINHDGVTLQTLYSFLIEEWKTPINREEDLMQFTFPFTAITREQMILGGGDAGSAWAFADDNGSNVPPRKLIRSGGWQERDSGDNILASYTGIITLGKIDDDVKVEYTFTSGKNFKPFLKTGPVNEAVKIENFECLEIRIAGCDDYDHQTRRLSSTCLKEIGVTYLEAIVNRFALRDFRKSSC